MFLFRLLVAGRNGDRNCQDVSIAPSVIPAKAGIQGAGPWRKMKFGSVCLCLANPNVPLLSFPLRGNVLHKPLDSSFRWNDGGGDRCIRATFKVIPLTPSFQPNASRNDRFFCTLSLFISSLLSFSFLLHRHSSESWNPGGRGRDIKWIPNYVCLHQSCHSHPGGNVLHKPLDSSFRWNDGGGDRCIRATFKVIPLTPSFQPVASRNDRFFCALPFFLAFCCLLHFCSIVIPAKAGIQEGGAGILNGFRIMSACTKVVIPAQAEMYCINHWIPAFAGRLRASCPLAAYRTSCP